MMRTFLILAVVSSTSVRFGFRLLPPAAPDDVLVRFLPELDEVAVFAAAVVVVVPAEDALDVPDASARSSARTASHCSSDSSCTCVVTLN